MLFYEKITAQTQLKTQYEKAKNIAFQIKQVWKQSAMKDRHNSYF